MQELKELLLYGSDHPPWQESSFVIEELEESQYDCSSCATTDTDTDSLTASWTHYDKVGVAWHMDEQIALELPHRSSRRSRVTDFDLKEIFWKICLENNPNTLLEEMHNLPSWDSPDIFLDGEDDSVKEPGRDDVIEFFCCIKHIFDEPKEKSWTEEQKFGISWEHHLTFYDAREAELRAELPTKREWQDLQLVHLVESLDSVNLSPAREFGSSDQGEDLEDVEDLDGRTFCWSESAKFGSSWERHLGEYSESSPPLTEKSFIWNMEKILQIIDRLQPIDFNESFLKDLVIAEESEEIFDENRAIFEDLKEEEPFEAAPCWDDEHRFGKSWEKFLPEYEGQDRNINWNFKHKFGSSWTGQLAEIEEAAVKQLKVQVRQRRRRRVQENLLEIFWDIALHQQTNLMEPTLLQILGNLPISDSPDVFMDSSAMFHDPKAPKNFVSGEEILDIFNAGKAIFETFDNHDQDISVCKGDQENNNDQKEKKTKRSTFHSFKNLFTRFDFVKKKSSTKDNFERKKKVWWKKMKFPK